MLAMKDLPVLLYQEADDIGVLPFIWRALLLELGGPACSLGFVQHLYLEEQHWPGEKLTCRVTAEPERPCVLSRPGGHRAIINCVSSPVQEAGSSKLDSN